MTASDHDQNFVAIRFWENGVEVRRGYFFILRKYFDFKMSFFRSVFEWVILNHLMGRSISPC
jgi:hypothetical protein